MLKVWYLVMSSVKLCYMSLLESIFLSLCSLLSSDHFSLNAESILSSTAFSCLHWCNDRLSESFAAATLITLTLQWALWLCRYICWRWKMLPINDKIVVSTHINWLTVCMSDRRTQAHVEWEHLALKLTGVFMTRKDDGCR